MVYQQIVNAALLHPKFLVSFPRIPFPETLKLRIRGFPARNNSCKTFHYEAKCCKVLWLQARQALWSNCKRTHSSESRPSLWECCFARSVAIRTGDVKRQGGIVFSWKWPSTRSFPSFASLQVSIHDKVIDSAANTKLVSRLGNDLGRTRPQTGLVGTVNRKLAATVVILFIRQGQGVLYLTEPAAGLDCVA